MTMSDEKDTPMTDTHNDTALLDSAKGKLTVAEWEAVIRHLGRPAVDRTRRANPGDPFAPGSGVHVGVTPHVGMGAYNGLGRVMKMRRADLGMKRKTLAEQTGISYSYLSNIEDDTRRPSIDVLQRIGQALDMDLSTLVADL